MSSYFMAAYNPRENAIRVAFWLDDYFGKYVYGVKFDGDDKYYTTREVDIPTDVVFVPKEKGDE